MSVPLHAISLHARNVPSAARQEFAQRLAPARAQVSVVTCHRVELYAAEVTPDFADAAAAMPPGAQLLHGEAALRHLVRLAVGLESAVLAEDQVLHQLRRAARAARTSQPLPAALDRALDAALRAGRRARTWMPHAGGLAELALRRLGPRLDSAAPVIVVGAGEMGRRAARALAVRGTPLAVTSRTPERAALLARELRARVLAFDPGAAELRAAGGIVIALAGAWPVARASWAALLASDAWIVDLSSPPALPYDAAAALRPRLTTIDDLAEPTPAELSARLVERLEELVEATVAEHIEWAERHERNVARALAERVEGVRAAELDALWQRVPELDPGQRAEVERMTRRLAQRLLREPLEQIGRDRVGDDERAARALFRL
jgi:glutamyl-tRNA reductase